MLERDHLALDGLTHRRRQPGELGFALRFVGSAERPLGPATPREVEVDPHRRPVNRPVVLEYLAAVLPALPQLEHRFPKFGWCAAVQLPPPVGVARVEHGFRF